MCRKISVLKVLLLAFAVACIGLLAWRLQGPLALSVQPAGDISWTTDTGQAIHGRVVAVTLRNPHAVAVTHYRVSIRSIGASGDLRGDKEPLFTPNHLIQDDSIPANGERTIYGMVMNKEGVAVICTLHHVSWDDGSQWDGRSSATAMLR